MAENKKFLRYKGYPLVRKNDEIYYGNMSDQYVVWMQITEKKKVGDIDVASKVKLYKMATDETLNPIERVVKQSEKTSLYEALDIAVIRYESVQKLADRIYEKKGRTDDSKFSRSEDTLVNQRLLDYTEAHTAHIVKAVCHSGAPECPVTQSAICICLLLGSDFLL